MKVRISIPALVAVAILAVSPTVQAGSACSYDPDIDKVSVIPGGASRTRVFVATGGDIKVNFSGTEFDCGDATTANTTLVGIGATNADEVLSISQKGPGGAFPPNISFVIEAEGGLDFLRLIGSPGPDSFRFGIDPADSGVRPAADLYGSGDVGIRIFGVEFLSARMLGGADSVTGRPGAGFDGPLTMALDTAGNSGADVVIGGTAGDLLSGGSDADIVKGLAGGDFMLGGAGDDRLGGGPGVDTCHSGPGDDRLRGCESES